jgi:MraZ protein
VSGSTGFYGSYRNKIDAKGRVSIPADFRTTLQRQDPDYSSDTGARVLITYGLKPDMLVAYSMQELAGIRATIDAMDYGEDRDLMEQIFGSESFMLTVDDSGRTVFPQALRDAAGLEGEVAFAGKVSSFEIMRTALADEIEAETRARKRALGPGGAAALLNAGRRRT